MKKSCLPLLLLLIGCAASITDNRQPEALNSYAHKCSFEELCSSLEKYQTDGRIVNVLLREFNRRNISYLNCKQYQQ